MCRVGHDEVKLVCTAPYSDKIGTIDVERLPKVLHTDFNSAAKVLNRSLRWQQSLIASMKTPWPKVAVTRWLSIIRLMTWFENHRIAVQAHFDEKSSPCRPSAIWWVLTMSVYSLAKEASMVIQRIQGMPDSLFSRRVRIF